MAYSTFTLTGTYRHFNGDPAQGTIEIIPSVRVVKDTTGDVILSGRVKVQLDAAGSFTVELPDPRDTSLAPFDFGYTVVAKLHHTHIAAVSFGPDQVDVTVNVEDVTPVDPATFDPKTIYVEQGEFDTLEGRVDTLETTPKVTSYNDLTDTPTLATVATSGAYVDLTGTPTIPTTPDDIGAADASVQTTVETGRLSDTALNNAFGRRGANVARFIQRARSGEDLAITCLGDSILEGTTVTDPATDGAMILLAADLSDRFGVTVTQTNHASSGYTAHRLHVNGNVTAAIADDADLYIVSAMDKNDLGADINGPHAPGYAMELSLGAIERMIRTIRTQVPKADIIVMSTNPYVSGSSSNTYQQAKDEAVKRLAASYGCEWVDVFAAFTDLGDYSALLADSTHPNTAGHRLMADTLLAHLPDTDKAPIAPGAVARLGLFSPELVNTDAQNYGYPLNAAPGTANGVTYTTGGSGWSGEVTSTVGDYVEVTATARELHIQISTGAADAVVVDLAVDGVPVETDLALSTLGKQGNYWITLASGLDGTASHTARLTLKSGTLRTYATSALAGAVESGGAGGGVAETQVVTLIDELTTTTVPTDGSYVNMVDSTLALPAGWGSAIVQFVGGWAHRVSPTTTTERTFNTNIQLGTTTLVSFSQTILATTVNVYDRAAITEVVEITASQSIKFRARTISTDKTNAYISGKTLRAILTRTS